MTILVEIYPINRGKEGQKAINLIEEDFNRNWYNLIEYQRKDDKIRVMHKSWFAIKELIDTRRLTKYQLRVIKGKIIEVFED